MFPDFGESTNQESAPIPIQNQGNNFPILQISPHGGAILMVKA